MTQSVPPALECRGIHVRYGDVKALVDVGLALEPGAIHAVVGQNGAGKTTFARVAAGLVRPDSGEFAVGGRPIGFGDVASSRAAGVELVHQSFALPPSFTVAEALEFSTGGGIGFFRRHRLTERWRAHLQDLELDVDPASRIRNLPVEARQGVEIARALATRARLLILDEPTAVLPPAGVRALFGRIRSLAASGVTIVLILHKIREVFAIADTISVLRSGRLVAGPMATSATEPDAVARQIIGSDSVGEAEADDLTAPVIGLGTSAPTAAPAESPVAAKPANSADGQAVALELDGVGAEADADSPPLTGLSLTVRHGEIVGVAGVEGNGQLSLLRSVAGLTPVNGGEIALDGVSANRLSASERRSLGLRIIPFDRNAEGLSLHSSIWENWSARELAQRPLLSRIRPARLRERCRQAMAEWSVEYASTLHNSAALSGGNAQKLILAREIDAEARLILAANPSRGLDLQAAAFVGSALRKAARRGAGVLLISSDLDELFSLCDRLLVMLSGGISGSFSPPYDMEAVGAAMTGVRQ